MAYNIGDRVGDYEIVDVLGAGGMGKVYKVRNVISERFEAMKVLLPNLQSDPDLADRFMREIKVQASLQHPNIAALHTALRVNNQLLMLIEFVEGSTVETELTRGRIPVARAVDYLKQVLQALSYAHARGVVHRDIKPANMMVTPQGAIKLMDFGIARLSADRRLTQTGRTVGSLYYMSPEQIQGAQDLDARSDLYSLGVSLYEMVTARRPFQGDSDYSIMAAHLSAQPIPPIQIDPALPSGLNDVILTAISKDPAQRFQTADAFRKALENVAAPQPATRVVAAPPPPPGPPPLPATAPKTRRGLYMAVGSLVTIAILVVVALQGPKWFGSSAASTKTATTAPEPSGQKTVPESQVPAPVTEPAAPSHPQETAVKPVGPLDSAVPGRLAAQAPRQTAVQQAQVQAPPPSSAKGQVQAPVVAAPAATSAAPVQSPPAKPTQTAPAEDVMDSRRIEELRKHRELLAMLVTRANSARATLSGIRQQQSRMGVGLRADISTAEQQMGFYLGEAEGALKAADPERMKKALDSAERNLEKIENFTSGR